MTHHWGKRLITTMAGVCWVGLLCLTISLTLSTPAWASIHTYHEQPGQTTVRSRQSLRDKNDLAWQATVFKRRVGSELQGTYLRLVGFPERVVVDHQQSLLIETGTLAQWQAPSALDPKTKMLPENVAQYDFSTVLSQLKGAIPLTLRIPLDNSAYAYVVVAPFVVDEWLQLDQLEP
jgi:hypothetical protein